jgi:hypothetical protein
MMSEWTAQDLVTFGEPDEVTIATMRKDGTLRKPVIVWIVRVGEELYVRSVNGRDASWFRGVQSRHEGRIHAGSAEKDVAFEEVDGPHEAIDAEYWNKYRRYPGIVPSIVKPEAQAATIRLVPRQDTQ